MNTPTNRRGTRVPHYALLCLFAASPLHGEIRTWDGGKDTDWSTKQNWDRQQWVRPGDDLIFAGSGGTANNNDTTAGTSYSSITFASNAAAFTLSGNSVTLGGSLTNQSAALQTVDLALILPGLRGFETGTGGLQVNGAISGAGGLQKSGAGVLTLTGTNTYTGATNLLASTTFINGTQSTGPVAVSAGATLAGTGLIGGQATISGTHSPGSAAGVAGTQVFSGGLEYAAGSVFTWDLTAANTSNGFDKVTGSGALTVSSTAIFRVVLGDAIDLNTTFWQADRSWAAIFTGFTGGNFNNSLLQVVNRQGQTVPGIGGGHFSIQGTTLEWSANPEPSSAVTVLLLAAGLLRRKRS